MRDEAFILQLRNWRDRDMSKAGAAKMLRLLEKYAKLIPDAGDLRQAYIDEQLQKLSP
jgi:hypothetical protein